MFTLFFFIFFENIFLTNQHLTTHKILIENSQKSWKINLKKIFFCGSVHRPGLFGLLGVPGHLLHVLRLYSLLILPQVSPGVYYSFNPQVSRGGYSSYPMYPGVSTPSSYPRYPAVSTPPTPGIPRCLLLLPQVSHGVYSVYSFSQRGWNNMRYICNRYKNNFYLQVASQKNWLFLDLTTSWPARLSATPSIVHHRNHFF